MFIIFKNFLQDFFFGKKCFPQFRISNFTNLGGTPNHKPTNVPKPNIEPLLSNPSHIIQKDWTSYFEPDLFHEV